MDTTSLASKSSYCSEGAPQKGKSELCPYVCHDRCIWFPAFFSFFSASFLLTLLHSGAIPSLVVKQGAEQRLLNANHSLDVLILLHFMLLVDLC